jgi:hypothetical protein
MPVSARRAAADRSSGQAKTFSERAWQEILDVVE